jgi:hypothetical protein
LPSQKKMVMYPSLGPFVVVVVVVVLVVASFEMY